MKKHLNSLKKAVSKLGDLRLNARGTIGTEPVARRNKSGGFTRGTEVKLGKLGKIFIKKRK